VVGLSLAAGRWKAQNLHHFLFLIPGAFKRWAPPNRRPKEEGEPIPPIVKVITPTRSRALRPDVSRHARRRRRKIPYSMKYPLTVPNIGGFFPKKEESLATPITDLMPLLRVLLSGCNAFVAGPCLCFSCL